MLPIHLFRTNKELILDGLKKKNFKDLDLVDKIINIETNWKQFYSNWDFKLWHFNDMNQFIYQKFFNYHRAFHSCLNKIDIFKYFVLNSIIYNASKK